MLSCDKYFFHSDAFTPDYDEINPLSVEKYVYVFVFYSKNMFISKLLISLFWSWDSLLFCLLFNLLDAQEKVSIGKYIQSEYVR